MSVKSRVNVAYEQFTSYLGIKADHPNEETDPQNGNVFFPILCTIFTQIHRNDENGER
jgi:hypothetical protein